MKAKMDREKLNNIWNDEDGFKFKFYLIKSICISEHTEL